MTVVAWPGQEALALDLADQATQDQVWPGLGRQTPNPLRLLVVPDAAAMAQLGHGRLPGWGAGFALPGARTVLIRADAGDPRRILRHELAHLALHQAVRVRVPRWFDEGYATWAAGEWSRLAALRVNLAVLSGRLPSLRGLDGDLRRSALDAEVAYALAASAVLELARLHPSGDLAPLLDRLRAGEGFDAALTAATGLTPGQFEVAWQRSIRRRYNLISWLTIGGFWAVVALAVIVAATLRRGRDRERRQLLERGWVVPDAEAVPPPE